MKRIQAACLQQTISFELKSDFENHKANLDKKKILYKIEEENTLPDGSMIVKLKRQYNSYNAGDYMN